MRSSWLIQALSAIGLSVFAANFVAARAAEQCDLEPPVAQAAANAEAGAETDEDATLDEKQLQEMIERMETERKKELEALASDPAWKPSHQEVRVIRPCTKAESETEADALHSFCLDAKGNVLAACGGDRYQWKVDEKTQQYTAELISSPGEIRRFGADGKPLGIWPAGVTPQAICVSPDGAIFVAGEGRIAKLSAAGKPLTAIDTPPVVEARRQAEAKAAAEKAAAEAAAAEQKAAEEGIEPAAEKPVKKPGLASALVRVLGLAESSQPEMTAEEQAAAEAAMAESRQRQSRQVTGIAATDRDLFVCCAMTEGYGYAVWRFDHDLQNPVMIVKDLRGCCGQMDIQTDGDRLWIPVNGEHKVKSYDRDGKELSRFGRHDRKKADGFGGCCEPKNLRIGRDGTIYAAESGPPVSVKRFDAEGKFLGVVALPNFKVGCVRATVAVSDDGSQVYVLNTGENAIHVLADKRETPTHEQTSTIDLRDARLNTFCMARDGKLLLACGGQKSMFGAAADGQATVKLVGPEPKIHVYSPEGKPLAAWPMDFAPQAIAQAADGAIYVAGEGRIVRLDSDGKVLAAADAPHVAELPPLPAPPNPGAPKPEEDDAARQKRAAEIEKVEARSAALRDQLTALQAKLRAAGNDAEATAAAQKEYRELLPEFAATAAKLRELKTPPEVLAAQQRQAALQQLNIAAMAVSDEDVFIACRMTKGFGFAVWRTDRKLSNGKLIVEGLRGCCGQMDIQACGGDLFVAENARKKVLRYDRDGQRLGEWGESDRVGVAGFGSCCNPMNLAFNAAGEMLTSESALGRVKRYSLDGQLLGVVGTATVEGGCKNVAVGISPDGRHVYVMDIGKQRICVMTALDAKPEVSQLGGQ